MELMNKVYLIYDASIENTESITQFISVLEKAGFSKENIIPINEEDYQLFIDKNLPNYSICLNQTFKNIFPVFSEKLEVPVFEFFNKQYIDETNKILLTGIILNIADIFKPEYKRYAWDLIVSFYKYYEQWLPEDSFQVIEQDLPDYLGITITEDQQPSKDVIQESIVNAVPSIVENNLDYKSFYMNVKQLISQFNIVQEQLKNIEIQLSET